MGWCCLLLIGLLCVARSDSWNTPATAATCYHQSPYRFWLPMRMDMGKKDSTDSDHDNALVQVESSTSTSRSETLLLPGAFLSELQKLDKLAWNGSNSNDAKRAFHGRGGCFGTDCEHLALDWYPPVWVLTSFGVDLSHQFQAEVATILMGSTTTTTTTTTTTNTTEMGQNNNDTSNPSSSVQLNLVYQLRNGANSTTTLVCGMVPDPHIVSEHGLKYYVKVLQNQNHGLFLDMAHGRAWMQQNAKDCRVLNLFAYTCAFSVAAMAGGATEVINIDMAGGALKTGQRNHDLNQNQYQFPSSSSSMTTRFLAHDIFKSWGKLTRLGPYDIVVADPPSYQKGSFVATKDYVKIIRRLPSIVTPGGHALLCLNAPELEESFLMDLMTKEAPTMEFVQRLPNPPTFPTIDPSRALKILLYRYNPIL